MKTSFDLFEEYHFGSSDPESVFNRDLLNVVSDAIEIEINECGIRSNYDVSGDKVYGSDDYRIEVNIRNTQFSPDDVTRKKDIAFKKIEDLGIFTIITTISTKIIRIIFDDDNINTEKFQEWLVSKKPQAYKILKNNFDLHPNVAVKYKHFEDMDDLGLL